ncbi:MAG: energy-coupling factor ABC transporter ATP-binding protein, partial [Coprobacillaceae bacterium]
ILDEATSMLDPIGKREINSLVKELNKEKDMTIISITHDIEEAVYADKIILLNKGEVIDIGVPEDILRKKEQLETLELDIPFALKISEGLQKRGIKLTEHLVTEEMVEELCQLHLKN